MDNYRVEDDQLIIESVDENGNLLISLMPMLAIASRMELLGIDDPGVAVEVLKAEHLLADDDRPYKELLDAVATSSVNEEVRSSTLSRLPIDLGPDNRDNFELKEYLRQHHRGTIDQQREVARMELAPRNPAPAPPAPKTEEHFPPKPDAVWIDPVGKELVLTPKLEGLVLDLDHTHTQGVNDGQKHGSNEQVRKPPRDGHAAKRPARG